MSIARVNRWIVLAVLLAAVAGARVSPAASPSRDEQFIEGLRRRGLFELAETYCTDRLADAQLSDVRRAGLSIELSRAYADHALHSAPPEQAALWQKAGQVVDNFAARNPRHPLLPLVRMQGALATLTEAGIARENAELSGESPRDYDGPRTLLRGTIATLRELEGSLSAERQRAAPLANRDDGGQMSVAQRASLELHVRHQLARALRNQALCYPAGSADRINSLGQAIEQLAALARRELTADLAWSVRLDEIACLRQMGNVRDAEQKLAQAERAKPPDDVAPRLRAERIRLALARDRVEEAVSEAGPPQAQAGAGWADANCAQLEAYLAGWRRAQQRRDQTEADALEQSAVAQVRAIEQTHGPPHSVRAETLLAQAIAQSGGSESPATLLLAAQSLYRGGRLDQAQAAYDTASERAVTAGDKNTWFDIEYAAAALAQQRKDHRAALDRFRKLAIAMPRHPRAADAHLLAAHSAAQVAAGETPPKLDVYEQLLREHVATWPDSATSGQAWWWLGRLKEHQQAWQEAIRALANVAADHGEYDAAVAATGRCYEAALDALRRAGNPNELLAGDAVEYFERVLTPPAGKSPTPSEATRAATLAAARIYLKEVPGGGGKAERLLTAALRADAAAPPEWKRAARTLLIAALAASGQVAAADQLIKQTPIGTAAESMTLINLLGVVRQRAAADAKGPLADLEIEAIADVLAKEEGLDPTAAKDLARRRIDALVEVGRRDEAALAMAALAAKYPNDGQVQEDLADLLATGGSPDELRAALAKWRDVTAHSRPGSPRWFRAHLATAQLLLELGHAAKARAAIKLVEASHPDLGGAEMKARFLQLLAECER